MATMTAAELLSQQAKQLPESIALEVLDFMEFLKTKRDRRQPNEETLAALKTETFSRANSFQELLNEAD
ncbi:MAG TPA: DUF2281 domain-containing protein [Thiolinea sp.]|nr:DUF2281 domain-containing protein [Thiolinea sp.]